jgi:hypothetical protein
MTKSTSATGREPAVVKTPTRRSDPLRVLSSLTPRDRFLMDLIAEHQVFTTAQLADIAFVGLNTAQRRLVRLYRLDVLDRFRWHVAQGSIEWRYTLGPVGASLVAASREKDPPRPAEMRRRTMRLSNSPRLGHLLGCNGVFAALMGHARCCPGADLEDWWSERQCAQRYAEIVRPDAYAAWAEDGRRVEFFFEYDTGTESLGRLVDKLAGYADLADAGGPAIPVLFWLPSAAREADFRRLLRRPRAPVATANTELAQALGACPADEIWLPAESAARRRLIHVGGRHPSEVGPAAGQQEVDL